MTPQEIDDLLKQVKGIHTPQELRIAYRVALLVEAYLKEKKCATQ